jgi:hypothetical protein
MVANCGAGNIYYPWLPRTKLHHPFFKIRVFTLHFKFSIT